MIYIIKTYDKLLLRIVLRMNPDYITTMIKLVLLRHGQSVWNQENKFTGWTDVDLSGLGIEEAHEAGRILKKQGFEFDLAFVSVLKRAIRTLDIVLEELGQPDLPRKSSWRLNEKHYGVLQGFNKAEMAEKVGEEKVHLWRRAYDVRPPALEENDSRHPANDPLYKNVPRADIPATECLKDTVERFLPYWHEEIVPELKAGKRVLISAHGNSLRALVKYLDNIPDEEIVDLNIPTGVPLVYELDDNLIPLRHYYLGDPEKIQAEIDKVKAQGEAQH